MEEGVDFAELRDDARRAEELGFDGLFLLDHLLPISGVHTSAWLDTIVGLSALAISTERIRLGTASLVAGFRHPVYLAKQLASVAVIAGPRLVLGAGAGWYGPEYAALGYDVTRRGSMTDETLLALRTLLTEERASFQGAHWQFDDITIKPRPSAKIPFLIAGGGRVVEAGSDRDLPRMAGTVLHRIVRWDGWVAPCAGDEAMTFRDLSIVKGAYAAASRNPSSFRLSHVQWTHVVDTEDRDAALAIQLPAFRHFMGQHHRDEHLVRTYLVGSTEDIIARVKRIRDAGFHELIVGPVVREPEQMELIAGIVGEASRETKERVEPPFP